MQSSRERERVGVREMCAHKHNYADYLAVQAHTQAIGSTMGAYPRDTGSNPVEGNGHFFPSHRQLYLSSFSDTHTHARARAGTSTDVLMLHLDRIGIHLFFFYIFATQKKWQLLKS